MDSLSRSARSTGPVVVLVTFSLVFATAWEHDRPHEPVMVIARRDSNPGEPSDSDVAPPIPVLDHDTSLSVQRASDLRNGLESVADICESSRRPAVAGIVGLGISIHPPAAEPQQPRFAGPAAFLCGTLQTDETPRAAELDDEADWAIE